MNKNDGDKSSSSISSLKTTVEEKSKTETVGVKLNKGKGTNNSKKGEEPKTDVISTNTNNGKKVILCTNKYHKPPKPTVQLYTAHCTATAGGCYGGALATHTTTLSNLFYGTQ